MVDRMDLANVLRGRVRVWNENGEYVESTNLVVYNGGDIIAKLLGGDSNYFISHMYFAFENTAGAPAPPAAARTDTAAAQFWALVAPQDFIRAPILTPVTYEAADANHLFNRVTFYSVSTASTGENGTSFGAAHDSKVFALGLVAAPGPTPSTDDLLYAHYILPAALPAAGSGQISATWATEAD